MPLWESHFHKVIIFLLSNQWGRVEKTEKWTLHIIKCFSLSEDFRVCWGPRLKRQCKQLTSGHTYTTTCGLCETMQANIALPHTMNELIEKHSDSYQITFILWSGGSGHFMQWELCSREIRRELLQRAQFMNAVNIRGMQHLVTSSWFSSWMLSESD